MPGKLTAKRMNELVREANRTTFAESPFGVALDGKTLYLQSRKEISKRTLLIKGEAMRDVFIALQTFTNYTLGRSA